MTKKRTISIFIEGNYDRILFKEHISKLFRKKGLNVELIPYKEEEKNFIPTYIETILNLSLPHLYIFITDIDNYKTTDRRKKSLKECYGSILHESHIFVIIKMIEGWYLAGLSRENARKLSINLEVYDKLDANLIKKDDFIRLKPPKYHGKRAFYIDVAAAFKIKEASKRNDSLKAFLEENKL